MFSLVLKIEDVFRYRAYKNVLYYFLDKSDVLHIFSSGVGINIFLGEKLKDIFIINGTPLILNDKNLGYWLKDNNFEGVSFTIDSVSEKLGLALSTIWYSYYPVDFENLLYDLKTRNLIWKRKASLKFEGDLLIETIKNGFALTNLATGLPSWDFKIIEEKYSWNQKSPYEHQEPTLVKAEITRVIGVYQNTVWTMLNSGRLLGLDEQTGNINFDLTYPINFSIFFPDLDTPSWLVKNTHLDSDAGKLFGIYNHYYWELDLTNPLETYILYDVKESCQRHQILLNFLGDWNRNEIYFWEGSINNKVGVFSRKAKQVIWSTAIEEVVGKFPAIRKVDYQSNHLYVLDHFNSLHIFAQTR